MATAATSRNPDDPALLGAATAYGIWSGTARYHKGILDRLTLWSLGLSIGGAILAAAGAQIPSTGGFAAAGKILGVVGAAAVALAAFLSSQAQSNDHVKTWSRARSAAESLKSTIFLARARVGVLGGQDRAAQIQQRVEDITKSMEKVESRQAIAGKSTGLGQLGVADYITERVQDQISWYQRRAVEFQNKADWCRYVTRALGAVSVLLTAASFLKEFASAWAPVIATLTAALTAHLKNRQYQVLTSTYSATMMRLTTLLGAWQAGGKTDMDKAERDTFIQKCEETMSTENGAWSTMWSEK